MLWKQWYIVKWVFDWLCDECGFIGGYMIIKDYIWEWEWWGQEVFVLLVYFLGYVQVDFGEVMVRIGGVEQKVYFFVLDLLYSDVCYVCVYLVVVVEVWVDGYIYVFVFFGVVFQLIVYDNDWCLVVKILFDGICKWVVLFSGFLFYYLIWDCYGCFGKGNDKGNVEGLVGYCCRNFMVLFFEFVIWEVFNFWLEE